MVVEPRNPSGRLRALSEHSNCPMLSRMPANPSDASVANRPASLLHDDGKQAVRIPRVFEIEDAEVPIREDGDRPMHEPIREHRLLNLLASWNPLASGLPAIEDPLPQTRDAL